MSFRIMARKVKDFVRLAIENGLWTKTTKLKVDPEIMNVKVRETRKGYEIDISMKVDL